MKTTNIVDSMRLGYVWTVRVAIACLVLMVLMACKGSMPASSSRGSQASGSQAPSGSSSAGAPTCRAINEHGRTLLTNLHPQEVEDVLAANPRRLEGFPSPEMIAAYGRAMGERGEMNPAEWESFMEHKTVDIFTAECEKRAPSDAQRTCWINATTYAAFVACDSVH